MIVTCPQCETQFTLPDDMYRPGRKVRCSNCGAVFALPEEDDALLPESPAPVETASDDAFNDARGGASGGPLPEDAAFSEDARPGDDLSFPPASLDDVMPPVAEKNAAAKRGVKKPLLLLGLFLLFALLGYGAFTVYSAIFSPPKPSAPARVADGGAVESLGGRTSGADQEKEAARQASVRRLTLENVRQYTVKENEKAGPMVVVEGSVVNNFETPKDLVLLEITLYDDKGNALIMREQYCGVTLSLLQLRTLPQAAIEGALVNQSIIIANNTNILPGSSVPFTAVFFDLPQSAYEFEVKVVDVQDPAKK